MAYRITLQIDEDFAGEVDPKPLRAAARAALAHESAPEAAEATIVLTDDRTLRRLNREFLKEDHVTDVLSFASADRHPQTRARLLGDVIISYPRAAAQAKAGGHSVRAELLLLVVHGLLHLLGHAHARPAEKSRMWAAQSEILKTLKAPVTGPAE